PAHLASSAARRTSLDPSFLLHHHPWRDSSRILELLTRSQGRVAVFARAARRGGSALPAPPHALCPLPRSRGRGAVFARAARRGGSALPAALQPFGTILVSYSARGEAGQLTGAER